MLSATPIHVLGKIAKHFKISAILKLHILEYSILKENKYLEKKLGNF